MGHDALAQLGGHLMDIIFVEVECSSHLGIRKVKTHEVQTQHPDTKRLMMTGTEGVGQIVKATMARLTPVVLAVRLGVDVPLLGDLRAVAMGTLHAFWPAYPADSSETFGVVDERLNVYHGASIACRMA